MNILLAELERSVREVPLEKVPILLGVLATMTAQAEIRLMQRDSAPSPLPDAGRYLDAAEVSARFHVTRGWLYRHKHKLPHSQPSRKVLLFPEQAITKWFAGRKGA